MIKKLSLTNFRGHNRVLEFGPGVNIIRGRNEAGKSTIKEAFAFVMQGTDSAGAKNPDHMITVDAKFTEVSLLTVRGTLFTRKKNRGATSTVKYERNGNPSVPMNQTEMQTGVIKLSPEVWMSCWNSGYFMSLDQARKMKVLGEMAKIDRRELIRTVLPEGTLLPAIVKLVKPTVDAQAVADLRRQSQNKRASDEGTLAQVNAQISGFTSDTEIDEESYQREINELEIKVQAFRDYEQDVGRYNKAIAANSLAAEKFANAKGLVEQTRNRLSEIDTNGLEAAGKGKALDQECIKAANDALELEKKLKTVSMTAPVKPKPMSGKCPTCGHIAENSEAIFKSAMQDYEKALVAFNKHDREIADYNKPILDQIEAAKKHTNELMSQKSINEGVLTSLRGNRDQAKKELAGYETTLSTFKEPQAPLAPTKPSGDEVEMKKVLDEKKGVLYSHKQQAEQRVQLKNQHDMLTQAIEKHTSDINSLAVIEDALKALPELETKKTLETIAVPGVKLTLLEGELVVTDEKGVDYRSLSDGRRMKIDIAFCGAIRKTAGAMAPDIIFIDNADLIDNLDVPRGVQVLVAEVDPNSNEVSVIPQ